LGAGHPRYRQFPADSSGFGPTGAIRRPKPKRGCPRGVTQDRLSLELGSYSPALVAGHLGRLPEQTLRMLEGVVELAGASGKIWGTHQSQIVTYLEKADREIPAEELAELAVPSTSGVGGHSHGQTEALMHMRARDGVVKSLRDGLGVIRNTA
jgi:hypothetical protein